LSSAQKESARRAWKIFKEDSFDPRLRTHKILRLDAVTALAASGALPENVNYAVKSSLLLSFLESVPDVSAKLKTLNTKDEKFGDAVRSAQNAAVLVLVY
jgi:hypothetical protein